MISKRVPILQTPSPRHAAMPRKKSRHNEGEMPVSTAATNGVDGMQVGKELLLEDLEGQVGGLIVIGDGGELRVRKRE